MTVPPDQETDDAADRELVARVREACANLPEVEEAELQGRPLFRVRRRRFAIVNGATSPPRPRWAGFGRSLHVLADRAELDALLADGRFVISPHHGLSGWVALPIDPATVDWDEVAELVESGYRRAAGRELIERLDRR